MRGLNRREDKNKMRGLGPGGQVGLEALSAADKETAEALNTSFLVQTRANALNSDNNVRRKPSAPFSAPRQF